ncbi:MAG: hypothetical protein ACX939_12110, partial [Hyphococcus sp.]
KMLRDLNDAVQSTFKAAAALENHEAVVARQQEGGKEIIASSRFIVRMIDELGGEPADITPSRPAPQVKLTAEKRDKRPPIRRLR